MLQLTQSPFLQALGYTIINSLWQFALLWLIYVSIHTFLKLSSPQKYAAGVVIQAAGFIWFIVTFTFYLQRFFQLEEIYQQKKISFAFDESSTATISEKFFSGIMQLEKVLPYLSVVYLLILLFLGFKWIKTYRLTKSIKTEGLQKIEVKWRLFVKQLSGQLGIKREVKIYVSEIVKTPLTIGFFKPFILIPLASLNHLTTDQMEAVILHELAHIKRFDYLFNLFLALIEIALFFNPFMHLISSNVKRERENCCDDWVLQYDYNPASYANALLQIATCQSSTLLVMQAADNKKILLNRIIRMIEKKEKTIFNYRYQLVALLVMLTVLSSLAVLSSRSQVNSSAVTPSPRQVIAQPMMEIANNPLYNPDFFIAPLEKKIALNEEQSPGKIGKKNTLYKSSLKIASNDTNSVIRSKKTFTRLPEEVNTVSLNTNDLFEKDADKKIAATNAALDEFKFPLAEIKEQEAALAEDQLKGLAEHLFEENRTLINQKQVIAAIKVALDQLKTIKIQLNATHQINTEDAAKTNWVTVNQLKIRPQLVQSDVEKLQLITKELQLQTEKAQKQRNRSVERNYRHNYNSDYRMPEIIYNLPLMEKPHSFSFEFSTEPKVKVAAPDAFHTPQRWKKVDKLSTEDNRDFRLENPSPLNKDKSAPKMPVESDNILIIRI